MPAYKGFKKTRLGASNIATLEKIWETGNHYPDDMTIQGIRDATKLRASKIVKWFKEKRDGARNQRHRDARNRQAEKEGFMEEDAVKEEEDMANKTVENKETSSKIGEMTITSLYMYVVKYITI